MAATPIPTQHTIDTMMKQIVPMAIPIAVPTALLLLEVGAGTSIMYINQAVLTCINANCEVVI